MRSITLLAATTLLAGLGSGCVAEGTYNALEKAYMEQRTHAKSIQATNDRLQTTNEGLRLQKEALEALLKKREAELALQREEWQATRGRLEEQFKNQKTRLQSEMQRKMGAMAERIKGLQFDNENNKLTLSAGVFFKAGSHELNAAARRTILEVCQALSDSNTQIHIVGHTDSDPIVKAKDKFPRGNWQLSSERALTVLLLMVNNSIAKNRLSFEGRGDTMPVEPNTSKANKAKNRRVEIYLRDA